ncbi:RluA family pseudouridine synthase [Radiobacillus sp. PE A8.2]|uniref:RluA family pseudouridine synthase n=1 Tax=Radiobacillus sp. PE A8.2 TaxID=3380349 RepID=UPI00388D86E7
MKWTVTKQQEGLSVGDYLKQKELSRRIIKAIKFQGGSILVNGHLSTVRAIISPGDTVEVNFPPEARGPFIQPGNIPIDIIYEDEDVLIINKPAGIASIPSIHHMTGTIANGIIAYYDAHDINFTVHIVTRLDRDTSGLLLVAKHRFSHSILSNDQKAGKVNRSYFAIVEGVITEGSGTIDAPIGRKHDSIIERMVTSNGQRAITHFQVISQTDRFSLVDVKLETGRTHQIRVHFAYWGHPLAGDDLYGGSIEFVKRQALHCKSLSFTHPTTKQRMNFTSKLPDDLSEIC